MTHLRGLWRRAEVAPSLPLGSRERRCPIPAPCAPRCTLHAAGRRPRSRAPSGRLHGAGRAALRSAQPAPLPSPAISGPTSTVTLNPPIAGTALARGVLVCTSRAAALDLRRLLRPCDRPRGCGRTGRPHRSRFPGVLADAALSTALLQPYIETKLMHSGWGHWKMDGLVVLAAARRAAVRSSLRCSAGADRCGLALRFRRRLDGGEILGLRSQLY